MATFILLFPPTIHAAAERVWYSNFDDQIIGMIKSGTLYSSAADYPLGLGALSNDGYMPDKYAYWSPGRDGSGYAFGPCFDCYGNSWNSHGDAVWLQLYIDNAKWTSHEIYWSYWQQFKNFVPNGFGSGTYENMKNFYLYFGTGVNNHIACSNNYINNLCNSMANGVSIAEQTTYPSMEPDPMDGNWHHFQGYVNIDTGQYKIWYDCPGVPSLSDAKGLNGCVIDDLYGPVWSSLYIARMNIPSADTSGVSQQQRLVDDIEVWDGMPNETQDATTPNAPQDLSVI